MPEGSWFDFLPNFEYGGEARGNPGPAGSEQVLKDWQRGLDTYFIDGVPIREILGEKREGKFESAEQLKNFFKENLLYKIEDEELKEHLAEQCMQHFHQSGIIHSANFAQTSLLNYAFPLRSNDEYMPQPPIRKINFTPTLTGVEFEETNKFQSLYALKRDEVISISENDPDYYMMTKSTGALTRNGPELDDLFIDAPNPSFRRLVSESQQKLRNLFPNVVIFDSTKSAQHQATSESAVRKTSDLQEQSRSSPPPMERARSEAATPPLVKPSSPGVFGSFRERLKKLTQQEDEPKNGPKP